eukprot:TRINITY_DN16406_c0_g1_i5.p1 TRINITY_DN16406_c0_g1~~TRINITY_DN16406_c0_g1_i5.p1  ORF type:complete len:585 (+),score=149.94 TRINITY_DN16406_c0_g1_i5:222-1976(+)
MATVLASLKKKVGKDDDVPAEHLGVPTRLQQNFSNMVDKVMARQRLGFCKSQVRNQATMEARDAMRKASLPRLNQLDEVQFKDLVSALQTRHLLRNDAEIRTIVDCLRIMRSLDEFALTDGILCELAQHMRYDSYRMRDRIIMEGDEMKGLFKLCLAGIMQTDIDEYKNAVYLETGEYFCEDHLRPHIRNNPEPLVMMVAKHNTHILTLTPEHYTKYIKPGLERGHQWKQEYLAEQQLFAGYSSLKLSAMASVAQVCTFRAGEAIVEQGRTKLTRYSDHHDGVFFMLSGQASCFKQVEPVKPEKKKDSFMERLEKEAEKKSKEDSVRARRASPEVPIQLKTNSAKHSTRHAEAALRRQSIQQAIANQRTQATRRQSIEARTFEMLQPAAAPAPPLRSESRTNRMGGPGQLYENMLMPLDDIQFGLDFKLASVCMSQADLRHLIGQDFEGLKALRRVSDAIVLCDNPDDFEGNSSMDCATVYLKGAAHDVDLTLRHLHTLGLNLTGGTEVHPYAPAELVMAVAKEHVGKVLSLMPEIAHDTHTEIHPNHVPSKMTAVTIIGREGDCRKAQQRFQSQLEKLSLIHI